MTFWKSAAIRAARTMAQGIIALIGSNAVAITSLDWLNILSVAATMGVVSVLTSIATGLPEATEEVE